MYAPAERANTCPLFHPYPGLTREIVFILNVTNKVMFFFQKEEPERELETEGCRGGGPGTQRWRRQWRGSGIYSVLLDSAVDHFGNLNPQPDPYAHQIKIRIRIRIKVISWIRNLSWSASVCRWQAKCMEYYPTVFNHFLKGLSFYLEASIWIWIRIRIRYK